MKTKLLSIFILTVFFGFSQTDIEQFHSVDGSQFTVMSGTIDQSAMGANVSWDFTNLVPTTQVFTDIYTINGTTSTIETFEGATLQSTVNLATSSMGELSTTGFFAQNITATYTDSAIIGTFPLAFGYSNTDGLEGNFTSDAANGSILSSSTINVDVDAWGNLKVGNFDGEVTRLRIIQNLDFNAFFNFPGTVTTYNYYDANTNDLVFRFNRVQVDPPIGDSIDQIVLESLSSTVLSNEDKLTANLEIGIVSNPVKHLLDFKADSSIIIEGVSVFDITGRAVLNFENPNKQIDVTTLKSGIYVTVIETNKGNVSKKFLKL